MNKTTPFEHDQDILDEYDFSTGVRGKYAARYHVDKTVIQLDADVAEMFPDAKSVNDVLRTLGKIIAAHGKKST